MKKVNSIFILLILLSFACTKREKRTYSTKLPQQQQVKAGPTYMQYYTADSVELENIQIKGKIDQSIAVKLIANSCNEIKADYLNYLMDTYKTAAPSESRMEPMFDAEHLAKFIVWQYVNEETESFPEIFSAIAQVFRKGDADARFLARYGICQMMIFESREYDVNYNSAFNPWLANTFKGTWFLLIDEMESGRS
ncbi:hypothetical protein [Ekhidna sp.]|uniref:hypothetical protein n=1 Tax=Ekhidna sp. TaxID=2608089 RepID=UPI003298C390